MQIKVYTINVKLPRWLRLALALGVAPGAILGICAIVYATAVTGQPDFVAGSPLSASSLNAHLGALQSQIDTANGRIATLQQTMLAPDANGNVGIGTNAPSAKLDVNGTVRANIVKGNNYSVRVIRDTKMNICFGSLTPIPFERERYDYGAMWDAATPTRLTAAERGTYVISASARIVNPSGYVGIRLNGVTSIAGPMPTTSAPPSLTTIYYLEKGDYVEAGVVPDVVGCGAYIDAPSDATTELMMTRISGD